jgi:hypothetical protein
VSRLGESNPGPTHYECVALPSELRRRVHRAGWLGTIANYIERHNAWRSPNGLVRSTPCTIAGYLISDQVCIDQRLDALTLPVRQVAFAIKRQQHRRTEFIRH